MSTLPVGLAHSRLKQYDSARQCYLKAIEKMPENPEPYFNMACLHGARKHNREAVSWLQKSVRKGFPNLFLLENHADLKSVRKSEEYRGMVRVLRDKY